MTTLGLLAAAVLVAAVVMLVPFKSLSLFGVSLNANVWNASGAGETHAYFEGCEPDDTECNSTDLLLAALGGPVLAVAMLVAIAGLLGSLRSRGIGASLAFTALGIGIVSFVLLLIGIDRTFDNSVDPAAGFYLFFIFFALLIAAGVVGLIPAPNRAVNPYAAQAAPAASAPLAAAPTNAPPGTRRVKCPRCGTVVAHDPAFKPVCPGCGFGA